MVTTVLLIINLALLIPAVALGAVAYRRAHKWYSHVSGQLSNLVLVADENRECITDIYTDMKQALDKLECIDNLNGKLTDKVAQLEKGLCPDHEMAKKATEEVNKFVSGVGAILGYDPFEVLEAQRNKGGEE